MRIAVVSTADISRVLLKRCDRTRVVYWDSDDFAMWTKRLERGRFRPSFSGDCRLASVPIDAAELVLIVEGIALAGAQHMTSGGQSAILPSRRRACPQAVVFTRWRYGPAWPKPTY
jgi:hypothetical protein